MSLSSHQSQPQPRDLFKPNLSKEQRECVITIFGDVDIKRHVVVYWQPENDDGFSAEYLDSVITLTKACGWSCTIFYNSKGSLITTDLREFVDSHRDILKDRDELAKTPQWKLINQTLLLRTTEVEKKAISINLRADFLLLSGGGASLPSGANEKIEEVFLINEDLKPLKAIYGAMDSVTEYIRGSIRIVEWPYTEKRRLKRLVAQLLEEAYKQGLDVADLINLVTLWAVRENQLNTNMPFVQVATRSTTQLAGGASSDDDSELVRVQQSNNKSQNTTPPATPPKKTPPINSQNQGLAKSTSTSVSPPKREVISPTNLKRKSPEGRPASACAQPIVSTDNLTRTSSIASMSNRNSPTLWTTTISRSGSSASFQREFGVSTSNSQGGGAPTSSQSETPRMVGL